VAPTCGKIRREDTHHMHPLLISLLAHVSAHRRLLINAYACGFMEEENPVAAARRLQTTFQGAPTMAPPQGSGLDAATSDMVAAMTDDAIEDFLDRVIAKLEQSAQPPPPKQPVPAAATLLDRLLATRRG
jgi:hypothetical protein